MLFNESRQLWGCVMEGNTFSLRFSKCEETFILYQQLKNGTDSFLPMIFCASWEVIPASSDKRQGFLR